jgi:diaminopimelate decarboxylase
MTNLKYDKNNHLMFGKHQIKKVIQNIPTPFFLYSEEVLQKNFIEFQSEALSHFANPLIAFALKSNSNPTLLKILNRLGSGADIVSLGECAQALKAGIKANKIVFSGVGKSKEEIEYALNLSKNGIFSFNVESLSELEIINQIAKSQNKKARVALRFNPEIKAKTHKYISTGGKYHKFGIIEEDIKAIAQMQKKFSNIEFKGLSVHIGSQLMTLDATQKAIKKMVNLSNELSFNLDFLDVGGGLGVAYHPSDIKNEPSVKQYMKLVSSEIKKSTKDLKTIVFEPGRRIVAGSGILVMNVIRTKESKGHKFLIVDAGMNDFVRPSLYEAYHHILPLKLETNRKKIPYDIVGPICETSDCFAHSRVIQEMKDEEILILQDTGAYGYSMGSNYNLRVRPGEYLLKNDGSISTSRKYQNLNEIIF